jgi:hypothetical protein
MNDLDTHGTPQQEERAGHRGHSWMMIACCIPMLAIAIVLVATGVVGAGFIFIAVMCTAMMAMMMRMMSGGGGEGRDGR